MSLALALCNPRRHAPIIKRYMRAGIIVANVKHMWLGSESLPFSARDHIGKVSPPGKVLHCYDVFLCDVQIINADSISFITSSRKESCCDSFAAELNILLLNSIKQILA